LTAGAHVAIDVSVKRLELARIRVCERCGRGRAELEAGDGTTLVVALDPLRAHELERRDDPDDVPWLSAMVLDLVLATEGTVREIVLDADAHGLRALVSISRGDDTDVVGCTAQEGISLAARGGFTIYATDEALATTGPEADDGHDRLH
jgi:hypothetical protein